MVNGYCRIRLFNHEIEVPNVPLREYVDTHLIPSPRQGIMETRVWWNDNMVHSVSYPLHGFKVHF